MRKAGEKPCGCQHSDPEVFQSIWKHLKTDGVPDQAANQMAAEMVIHGEDFDSSSKGMNVIRQLQRAGI